MLQATAGKSSNQILRLNHWKHIISVPTPSPSLSTISVALTLPFLVVLSVVPSSYCRAVWECRYERSFVVSLFGLLLIFKNLNSHQSAIGDHWILCVCVSCELHTSWARLVAVYLHYIRNVALPRRVCVSVRAIESNNGRQHPPNVKIIRSSPLLDIFQHEYFK